MTPIGACPTATSSANEEIVKKISTKYLEYINEFSKKGIIY
jgi:hypothetical protein